ncbi:MAG: hypothetical protein D6743_06775 [Calditrichaeota bacterium]|nr:MAG: hypothetical protein D6743_06775 [Calditrichota bacterium]
MANLWDDIAKTIREGVDAVVEKTEELTKMGRIKVDILNIKRNIEKSFTELGGKVYHLLAEKNQTTVAEDKAVKEIIECIKLLEKELEAKNAELQAVRKKESEAAASKAKAAAPAAAKAGKPKKTTASKGTTSAKKTAPKKAAGGEKKDTGTK